jgi:hypothetical protein
MGWPSSGKISVDESGAIDASDVSIIVAESDWELSQPAATRATKLKMVKNFIGKSYTAYKYPEN